MSSALRHYRLFGGVLASDVEIPELEQVEAQAPTWTLRSEIAPVPEEDAVEVGSAVVTGDVRVRMYRRARGLRLVFDDTGCFDVSADGRTIRWTHDAGVTVSDARADLTSRVIATALHAGGTLSLHGSAVVPDDEAIGFVAPKFHGKSTLALALVRAGAKLLADDTLPIVPGRPPLALPGLHAARLWPDSAERVGVGRAQEGGARKLLYALGGEHVAHAARPLAALYLLAPAREPRDGQVAWRTPINPVESAIVMIGHAKLAPLLTGAEAPWLFRRAAGLAAMVPVFRLEVVRDLDRLPEVVDTIRSWHTRAPAGAA